jgi:CRP/FNR family transcriptional regulator
MNTNCYGESCGECDYRSIVFNCLTPDQISFLAQSKELVKIPKGKVVVKEGDNATNFFFLRTGLAKLSRIAPTGKEQIVGIARPKDFVGLLSLFSSKVYQYSITAVDDSEFCVVDLKAVIELIHRNGFFAQNLLEKISQVSDVLIKTRLDLDIRQIRGRVAFILCYFAQEVYDSKSFNLPISRKELGDLIDMRVENVVRVLSEFRKDKIISIEGTTIEVLNPEKLNRIKNYG